MTDTALAPLPESLEAAQTRQFTEGRAALAEIGLTAIFLRDTLPPLPPLPDAQMKFQVALANLVEAMVIVQSKFPDEEGAVVLPEPPPSPDHPVGQPDNTFLASSAPRE
jgi:hypothetical protein